MKNSLLASAIGTSWVTVIYYLFLAGMDSKWFFCIFSKNFNVPSYLNLSFKVSTAPEGLRKLRNKREKLSS
jgi:hypothetical protein